MIIDQPRPAPLRRLWFRLRIWWRRMLATFASPPRLVAVEPVLAPPGPLSQDRALSRPIVVPARGFVFTFQVDVWITWYSDGLTEELLDAWSQQFSTRARGELTQQTADLARHFLPHQGAELEITLNRRLGGAIRTYQRSGVTLRARSAFRVRLDDEVKAQLRPAHLDRLRRESEHEVELRRAQMVDQLTHRWIAVINRLRRSPLAADAASLTDGRLAEILEKLAASDRIDADRLGDLLREVLNDSNRMGRPLDRPEADEIIKLLNEAIAEADAPPVASANGNGTGRLGGV